MQAYIWIVGLLVAWLGQWLNSRPHVDSRLVKVALALVGLLAYLLVEVPAAWHGEALFAWLDTAWIWALALPGAASLIGTVPGMATQDKEVKS